MPIVGTAGHVDHGKSTLVLALTGRDPDRWAEEKQRGLTIDLGFAWTEIEGIDVGFVDVPGHERFIKNMLAGVGAIDCALLVIAADSGWMPQTEEHAAVLDLLDTPTGVIALTRIDLVDKDTLELATLEIMDETAGTVLEEWPVVPVSPVTGEGIDNLRQALTEALGNIDEHSGGPFRMWVDRAFTVHGAGVVVTGTIASGAIALGDGIELLPGEDHDTIRGLHHHDQSTDRALAGSRTALNLQSTRLDDARRGILVCDPGSMRLSDRIVADLTPARSFDEIPRRGAFHLHIGTAHTPVTIRRLWESTTYRVILEHALPISMGDRFILRDSGRQTVVGGGRVLEPAAESTLSDDQVSLLRGAIDDPAEDRATALLTVRGSASIAHLSMDSGGGTPTNGLRAGSEMLSPDRADRTLAQIVEIVGDYQDRHRLRPGVPKAELATQVGVALDVVDAIVSNTPAVSANDGFVATTGFVNELTPDQVAQWASVRTTMEQSFDVPRMSAIDLSDEIIHWLIRNGSLVTVGPDLVFTSQQIDRIHAGLDDLSDGFSVSEFKDAFGMSRRQAVPALEWLDKSGWTRRVGDGRTVRQRP